MTHAKGTCYCGGVTVEVTGPPVTQGFCHCQSCRAWTGMPMLAYALWPSPMVRVTDGEENIARASRSETLTMCYCSLCGGNVMAESISTGMIDVFPMILKNFDFVPVSHVNYAERVLDVPDGLPKFRDMPEAAGGSGVMITE